MEKIKVKSTHITRFGRHDDDYMAITLAAVRPVLEAADLDRVRDIYLASYAPRELEAVDDPLRRVSLAIQAEFPRLRARYHGMFKTGGRALYDALVRTADPQSGDALIVGSEKMTHLPAAQVAGILAACENAHDRAYGATLPGLGGLVTTAYLERHGIPESAIHEVAVKNHRHGALNPCAQFQREVTVEDVASSPMVANPLRRLHCAPTTDGAAALLIGHGEGDTAIVGWGRGTDTAYFQDRADITRFVATARASRSAFQAAALTPADCNVVEIHDAFSSFELINLEDMGFYPPGTAWQALASGEGYVGSRLAINPSGGKKAEGHPIGATGVSSVVEIVDQLTGRAGQRQQPNVRAGVAQSVGGVSDESFVFVVDLCQGRVD